MAEETIFATVIQKLVDFGFYDFFFPFIITSVIMYALLRKSKVLGESNAINGVLAIAIGMLIFGFPILTGITFGTELSTFFVQTTVWILILVMAIVISSVFYPNITSFLTDTLKHRSFIFIMLAVAISIFIVSGLLSVFVNIGNPAITGIEPETPAPPADIVIIIAALIIFMVLIIISAAIFRRSG